MTIRYQPGDALDGCLPIAPLQLYDLGAVRRARIAALSPAELARFERTGRSRYDIFAAYRPHAAQVKLHRLRKHRFVAVCAGRRGGKTVALGHEFLARAFTDLNDFHARGGVWQRPPKLAGDVRGALQYWLVAPTYRHTLLMLQVIFEVLGGTDSPLILDYNRSEGRIWLVGGIKIEIRSADNPAMLVGDSLNGVWFDEAARVKPSTWTENVKPNLDDRQGWALFSTTPLGHNWFYQDVWQRSQLGTDPTMRDPRFAAVAWTTADNTTIPSLAKEQQLAKLILPPATYARNYLASFTAFDGQIFPAFQADSTHIVDGIPWRHIVKRWGGLDWGTGNPGCQLEVGLDDAGVVWVWHEDYQAGLTVAPPSGSPSADSWTVRLKRSARLRKLTHWWADPSGAGQILTCRGEGLDVRAAANDVQAGIDVLSACLQPTPRQVGGKATPGLYIHQSCKNLIRELVSYRWQPNGEKPIKEHDHAVDTLRYAVYSEHLRGEGRGIEALDWSIFDGPQAA